MKQKEYRVLIEVDEHGMTLLYSVAVMEVSTAKVVAWFGDIPDAVSWIRKQNGILAVEN